MKRLRIPIASLIVLSLLACQFITGIPQDRGGKPQATGGQNQENNRQPESTADRSGTLEIPANPARIEVTPDSTSAVEAVIPLDGGTLTATGADGTHYQLVIPPNALQVETHIRMTPVATLGGLPFGDGGSYAVQLAPEGLFLYEPAILTITPPQPIPVSQQILFGYRGTGENLILALPVMDSQEIKIQLLHFSGYGATAEVSPSGTASVAGGAPVTINLGGDADSRMENTASEQAQNERRGVTGMQDQWLTAYQKYREEVINPRIKNAGESCAAGKLALLSIMTAIRQAQLFGESAINDDLFEELLKLIPIVVENCIREEYERCVSDHIVHRILPIYLGWQRQVQLWYVGAPGVQDLDKRLRPYVEKCLRFEVVLESTVVSGSADNGFESRVKATVPMFFSIDSMGYIGKAPLVNEFFEFRIPDKDCTVNSNRGGGTFENPQIGFILETVTSEDEIGGVSQILLNYFPGETSEEFSYQCKDYRFGPMRSSLWTGMFIAAHANEASPEGGFTAADWEIFGNEYYAKREWQIDKADLDLVEVGTFKLYHKPGN